MDRPTAAALWAIFAAVQVVDPVQLVLGSPDADRHKRRSRAGQARRAVRLVMPVAVMAGSQDAVQAAEVAPGQELLRAVGRRITG